MKKIMLSFPFLLLSFLSLQITTATELTNNEITENDKLSEKVFKDSILDFQEIEKKADGGKKINRSLTFAGAIYENNKLTSPNSINAKL